MICCISHKLWRIKGPDTRRSSHPADHPASADWPSTRRKCLFFHSIPEEWPKSGQSSADFWGLRGHLGSQRGKNKASLLCYVCLVSVVLTREYKRFDMWIVQTAQSSKSNKSPSRTFMLCIRWCKDRSVTNHEHLLHRAGSQTRLCNGMLMFTLELSL